MRVLYTPIAEAELAEALAYVGRHSQAGAHRVRARLRELTRLIERHPEIGRLATDRRTRRVFSTPYPYVVFYEVRERFIVVTGIRHAARDPGTMPGDP